MLSPEWSDWLRANARWLSQVVVWGLAGGALGAAGGAMFLFLVAIPLAVVHGNWGLCLGLAVHGAVCGGIAGALPVALDRLSRGGPETHDSLPHNTPRPKSRDDSFS